MEGNSEQVIANFEKQIKDEAAAVFRQIVSEVTETPEFKKAKNDAINKALASWAGQSIFKKMVSSRMSKKNAAESKDAEISPKTKMITLGARYMAEKDKTDPNRTANLLAKPIKDVLMNTDFGNIYEMVAVSEARVLATRQMMQDVLKEFPTKAGILPAMKLKKANTSLKKKNLSLSAMENMTPEMLLGSMLNLFNALIEAKELGTFINNLSELIRKIYTGSVILGEAGKPLIELTLTEKLRDALTEVDPVVFRKAIVGLFETAEAASSAAMTSFSENPEILGELVSAYGAIKNSKIRRKNKKAALLEELLEEETGPELIEKGLADIDTQEIGETLNIWLRVINSIHESQPDVALRPISSLFSILDWDELQTTAQWLVPDMVESIKPVAGSVMPSLINGLCELLTPSPGEDTGELDEALDNLRNILSNNGGKKI